MYFYCVERMYSSCTALCYTGVPKSCVQNVFYFLFFTVFPHFYFSLFQYRCKIACLERKNRQQWQSLHRGWEWIRKDLRSRLRKRWSNIYFRDINTRNVIVPRTINSKVADIADERTGNRRNSELRIIGLQNESVENEHEHECKRKKHSSVGKSHPNYQAYHTCAESAAYVTAIRSEAIELKKSIKESETLRKAFRKLSNLNWVLCYERSVLNFIYCFALIRFVSFVISYFCLYVFIDISIHYFIDS